MPSRSPLHWRVACGLALAIYGAAAAGFAIHSPHVLYDFPLDDAWIERVYARAFAAGHGLAYNDGAQEAGITAPLWAVVSAPAHWLESLGGTPAVVLGVKALGLLLGATCVLALLGLTRRLTGSPLASGAAAALFAVEPRLIFAALAGMEGILLAALWLGAAWSAVARRPRTACVFLGLAPLARPEAVVLLPLGVAAVALVAGARHRCWRQPTTWLALVLPGALWSLGCHFANGHWLPNTFYVKAEPFELAAPQLRTAWGLLTQHGWGGHPVFLAGLAVAAVWLALRRNRAAAAAALLLLASPLAFLAAVVGSRSVNLGGFYWTRWADPATLALTAAFALGLGLALAAGPDLRLLEPGAPRSSKARRAAAILSCAGVLAVLLAAPHVGTSYLERRARLASDARAIRKMNVEIGYWIRANTAPEAVVGVNDAGAIRYFGERRTIDLIGLNNADIAFGRAAPAEIAAQLDWLAVFPGWLERSGLQPGFETRATFDIPLGEYTVCRCPGQTRQLVAERRR